MNFVYVGMEPEFAFWIMTLSSRISKLENFEECTAFMFNFQEPLEW